METKSHIKTKPDRPWTGDVGDANFRQGAQPPARGQGTTQTNGELSICTLSEILTWQDDPADLILPNGYLEKGMPSVICGPPGIGKSRFVLQLAIKTIFGLKFLGWETQGEDLRWLFLQSENSMRRLKADLAAMTRNMTSREIAILDEHLFIHGLIKDTDGILHLNDPEVTARIAQAVRARDYGIVVGDPLSSFSLEDLNADKEMLNTARDFGRLVKQGNQKRTPLLIHHARTGQAGAASATGFNRGSYARNSKALYGWTRAQINLCPYNENDNDILVVASGKCNNAREFEPFAIELDKESMTYARNDGIDLNEWKERVSNPGKSSRFTRKFSASQITDAMSRVVALRRSAIKEEVMRKTKMSARTFDNYWKDLRDDQEIEEVKEEGGRSKWRLK
jgi:hypothetical protein